MLPRFNSLSKQQRLDVNVFFCLSLSSPYEGILAHFHKKEEKLQFKPANLLVYKEIPPDWLLYKTYTF